MSEHSSRGLDAGRARRDFPSTRWSVVICAAGNPVSEERNQALHQLCESYWYPLYAYLRRHGHATDQAEDLVQGFFVSLLEKDLVARADPDRGRFRSFLLSSLRQFVARERQYAQAAKRYPPQPVLSLNMGDGEEQYRLEPVDDLTPERVFERTWAMTVLKRAMRCLENECVRGGKGAQFHCLKGLLTGQDQMKGREAAERLGMTEGAVRVLVHRLKRRYAEMLRHEVIQTLGSAQDADDEIKQIRAALAR
jgi:RNA polymerase sigma-70 factor (ECF subfamily)